MISKGGKSVCAKKCTGRRVHALWLWSARLMLPVGTRHFHTVSQSPVRAK